MSIKELVLKNRSYRRFYQEVTISRDTLKDLIELARLSATGGNVQPFKYILSHDADRNGRIFATLGWAAYLKDWPGPVDGERPSAYIVMLGDKRLKPTFGCDYGIAAQSILLGAVEKGLGGCLIATIQKPALAQALSIADHFEILMVVALGKPKEVVVIEPVGPDGDIKYWRDSQQVHHVPKRPLDDLIVG